MLDEKQNMNVIMVGTYMLEETYAQETRMRLEHERSHGLGMSALANAHTWNTNANIIQAWMLWKYMHWKHKR